MKDKWFQGLHVLILHLSGLMFSKVLFLYQMYVLKTRKIMTEYFTINTTKNIKNSCTISGSNEVNYSAESLSYFRSKQA